MEKFPQVQETKDTLEKNMGISSDSELEPRTLIYFPIVHDRADMGALSDSIKKASLRKMGRAGWKRKLDLIDKFWTEIEKSIDHLTLSYDRVRIYQDGLPITGKETELVKELARSGSRNHRLLLRLVNRGSQLMGTESLEALLEEYALARKTLEAAAAPREGESEVSGSASLLERRDRFIAQRINETLRPGEVGIIFLGMLHALEPWLDKDIHVVYPVRRPLKH